MEELDRLICNNFNSPNIAQDLNEYQNLKTELQTISENKGRVAVFRSKCRWVENGERHTKYFFNLKKKNYKKKTITELRMEDSISNNEILILDTIEKYYQEIYSSEGNRPESDFNGFIEHLEIPKLADEDRDRIEGLLTVSECKSILDTLPFHSIPLHSYITLTGR